MRPFFAADSIGRSFGERRVLHAASVWGHSGRITALLGRNGCGKTTLLRIGAGYLRADFGTVQLDGLAWERPRPHLLAQRGLFFLPERGLLSRRLTLDQHFRAVRWRFGDGCDGAALEDLHLEGLRDARSDQLSTGERRRAELAIALVRRPRCLLADEPFLGLEPSDAGRVAAALRRLADQGCAIIVTGHEVPDLLALAHDVVWMTAGTTHGLGAPEAAAAQDQFRREYLGPARAL